MALWLALVLPDWPLQILQAGLGAERPLVLADGPAQRQVVACACPRALACGIAAGQRLAAAQALAADLIVLPRDPAREAAALEALAAWAYQYSAQILARADGESGLLIEIGASRRLFEAAQAPPLAQQIALGLGGLGYRAASACAATPLAAWWLARARARGVRVIDAPEPGQLAAALGPLPLAAQAWEPAWIEAWHSLGLARIADLLRLPRASFIKRFGRAPLDALDRALGLQPDPLPAYTPPEHFCSSLDLPADLGEAAQLLHPATHLLQLAEGFLRGRAAAARRFDFLARHSQRRGHELPPTPLAFTLARPERDAARLGALLTERLARLVLPAPAIALTLAIPQLETATPLTASLLPPAPEAPGDTLSLIETLQARLGEARVLRLEAIDEHRPELASQCRPWTAAPVGVAPAAATAPRPLLLRDPPLALGPGRGPLALDPPDHHGHLQLLAGPERIESGWWDGAAVARDYFVARNPRGQRLWLYRELAAPHRWFLHGYFA